MWSLGPLLCPTVGPRVLTRTAGSACRKIVSSAHLSSICVAPPHPSWSALGPLLAPTPASSELLISSTSLFQGRAHPGASLGEPPISADHSLFSLQPWMPSSLSWAGSVVSKPHPLLPSPALMPQSLGGASSHPWLPGWGGFRLQPQRLSWGVAFLPCDHTCLPPTAPQSRGKLAAPQM